VTIRYTNRRLLFSSLLTR